jgi:hypothetical protein
MKQLAQILADNESNIVKILFGAIFLVIWAVSALMSMLAKKKEQERRERVRREIELGRSLPPMQQMPGPMAPPPMRSPHAPQAPPVRGKPPRPAPLRPAPPPRVQQQPKKRFPVKAPTSRRAQPVPVAPEARPSDARTVVESAPAPRAIEAPARRGSSPTAAALHAWLKPDTLRKQFILTEVLQPPLAMRNTAHE